MRYISPARAIQSDLNAFGVWLMYWNWCIGDRSIVRSLDDARVCKRGVKRILMKIVNSVKVSVEVEGVEKK